MHGVTATHLTPSTPFRERPKIRSKMENKPHTILTLPPELTINILEHLLLTPNVTRSPYHDILPITQASSQLRSTALSAPSLWSTIEITDKPASFNFAKLCLSRSGNHKLDISIRVLRKAESKVPGLLALLQYASTRIRCLSLRLSFANPKEWSAWCDSFKLLELVAMESFTFEAWRRESIAEGQLPPRSVFTLSEAVCSIKSLALAHTSVPPDTPALSGLLRLRISSSTFWAWPYQQLLDVLQSCQALEELELQGDGMNVAYGPFAPDNLPPVSRVHCSNLRRITFYRVENSIPALILANLIAPSLEFLSLELPKFLHDDCDFTWTDPPKVIPFDSAHTLVVSDGPLRGVQHQDHWAVFIASLFPGVRYMEVSAVRCRALLVTWSEQTTMAINPWSDLQSLVIDYPENKCVGHCQDILRGVWRLLDARRKAGCPSLHRVRLGLCDACELADKAVDKDAPLRGIRRLLEPHNEPECIRLSIAGKILFVE
ncbi:hypothetical protein FRB90_005795 [Tulasnella sp. 427]|nr:hypothetical protein FRB90_005795 [Tulasnella sp. 427]